MKVFIVLAACAVAVVSASKTHYGAGPLLRGPIAAGPVLAAAPLVSTGTSSQFRSEDNYGNYNFGYDEAHSSGSTSRREEQVNGVRRGSYSLSDADGRHRHVNYVADASGFHASIHTNEPGVEPKDSADVLVNKEGPVAVAPAPVYAAAAPIAAPAPVYAAPAPVYAAPAPLPAPVPIAAPLPLPAPVKGYYHSGPRVAVAAPVAPAYIEEPTPRAFSYSFGSTHLAPAAPLPAPVYAAAPAYAPLPAPAPLPHPAPLAAPAPIYQQQTLDY